MHDEAQAEQRRLAAEVKLRPLTVMPPLVAGVDVSYDRGSDRAVAVVAVLTTPDLELVESSVAEGAADFPYVPGLLSFRELPLLLEAVEVLTVRPGLFVVDGHGYAHPRRLGLASHLGVVTGVPAIGCGKTMFVGDHGPVGRERGSTADIVDDGEVVGCAVRTRTGVKPVYGSPGHLTDVASTADALIALAPRYRLPEPIRHADHLSRQRLRAIKP